MSEDPPSLPISVSFSCTTPDSPSKSPKRRFVSTSALEFFAPASSSFQPRPYAPNGQVSAARSKSLHLARSQIRSDSLAMPPVSMDPHRSDPNVIFIHPPFATFPNSHLHPDGLSFSLMAENLEWFLDPDDFVSPDNNNPHAIPYPPHLEPPRGWCPARKKDLREKGTERWPAGEEPKLRCTFCRRHYAGVNAKSMWRRHVFEKHKIAMSNRRDGNYDRPRGRGSGKENRQFSAGNLEKEHHDNIVNIDVAPQTDKQIVSHKSKFRSLLPAEETRNCLEVDRAKGKGKMAPPLSSDGESTSLSEDETFESHFYSRSRAAPQSPPSTPQLSMSSDSANTSVDSSGGLAMSPAAGVPPSPYNPLLTPSFRHASPKLPSDQPWRYPSPSHPLHSQTRELSLSMLLRDAASPLSRLLSGESTSTVSSPIQKGRFGKDAGIIGSDTPASIARVPRPTARTLFLRGQPSSPATDSNPVDRTQHRIESSPLAKTPGTLATRHKRTISGLTDDWFAEASFTSPTKRFLNTLSETDPFSSLYISWTPTGNTPIKGSQEVVKIGLEPESPVLRSQPIPAGLGIGLLDPFDLPKDDESITFDYNDILLSSPLPKQNSLKRKAQDDSLMSIESQADRSHRPGLFPKKRRVSFDI